MNIEVFTFLVTVFNFLVWIFFDYYGFYLISNVKYKTKDLLLIGYFIFSLVISLFNIGFSAVASLFEIAIFYFWFKNRSHRQVILGAALIIAIVDVFGDILINILQISNPTTISGLLKSELTNLVLLIIFLILIYSKRKQLFDLLSSKTDSAFLFLIGYFYISVEIFFIMVIVKEGKQLIITALFIILVMQSIFISAAFYFNYSINKKRLEVEKQKQLEEYTKNIENYANYLESTEDELRKFRHDVRNLLNSVDLDDNQYLKNLSEYVERYIKTNSFEKYKDLNHIKIKPLKNLILTKISIMIREKISYSFECTRDVENIPININLFDVIRVVGIAIDNAIESTKGAHKEQKINIMIFLNDDKGIEFEVRNTFNDENIDISALQDEGYTTKADHSGIGLANVKEIVTKYSNMFLDLHIEDNWFVFYLVMDEESN